MCYSKQNPNTIKEEEEPKLVSVNETCKEPLDLYQKTWKGTYIAKESPSPENRDLQHASSESGLLQREVTRFSTHYKNVKLKSQAKSLKAGGGNKRPFASHGKVKSQHCSPPPPKTNGKEPLPRGKENTRYSPVQLSQSTQFSYQHHFITVINKIKHTEGYGLE